MFHISNKTNMILGIFLFVMPILFPFIVAAEETKTDPVNKVESTENSSAEKDKTEPTAEAADTKSTSVETSNDEEKHLFMWKAIRDKQTVYLLGTIHAVRADFYPIPDEINRVLSESKELFVECIPDRDKIINVSKSVRSKYAYKSGDNLYKHLSPGTQRVFEEYLQWSGEPMEIYQTYRPFEVAGLIQSDSVRRFGLTVPGLDRYLISKAKQTDKKIVELESVEFQLNLLSSLSETEQDAELLSSLLVLKDVPTHLGQVISAWKQGNAEELDQLLNKASQSDPELLAVDNKIIKARNHSMVNRLEECLQQDGDGTYLVAVGSAHLVGKDGLPALLKEKGFTVSQVVAPKELPKTSFGSLKLQRLYYPEGRFSILLPGPALTRYGSVSGFRIVDYVYPTFAGTYTVGYLVMPKTISNSYDLNSFYNVIGASIVRSVTEKLVKASANKGQLSKTQNTKAGNQIKLGAVVQNSINISDHFGRQMQMELTDLHGESCLIKVRLVVVDQYLYILTVAGKKAWVNSPIANEVQNSLVVRSGSSKPRRR